MARKGDTMINEEVDEVLDQAQISSVLGSGEYEFNVFLSTDGKCTIQVKAETPEGRKAAYKAVKVIFEDIRRRYGTKAEMWEKVIKTPAAQTTLTEETKVCSEHNEPMILSKKGKWYHKNATGEFCFNNNQGWIKFGKRYGN